jgi:outer membrane protein OmpA-like peptidoglycan-associated protein
MRALLTFGAAMSLAIASIGLPAAAHADPAYSSDQVLNLFIKQKAAAEAAKAGKTRSICIGTTEDCKKQDAAQAAPPPPVATFDLLVTFEFDSDKLTPAAKDNLDQFAKALKDPRLQGEKFEIDGHTDAVGAEQYNYGLSERRAAAVVSYLSSQGLDPTYLVAKGFGKTKPRTSNPYNPENRRVETHLIE